MSLIQKSVLAGKEVVTKRAQSIVQCERDTSMSYDWSLLHQFATALRTPSIWKSGTGEKIEDLLCTYKLRHDNSGAQIPAPKIFDSSDCIPIESLHYEQPGYFTGAADETDSKQGKIATEGLKLLIDFKDGDWLVPLIGSIILTGNPSTYHVSSSQRDLPGTIVSQSFYSVEHAAEVLVHEGSHTAFNLALVGLGVENQILSSTRRYFSPWKGVDRPLFGFLHAVYSFGRVDLIRHHLGLKPTTDSYFVESLPHVNEALDAINSLGLKDFFEEHIESVMAIKNSQEAVKNV